ncbi:MAG: hypothetical protein ACUVQT_10155, partial [bacterium]
MKIQLILELYEECQALSRYIKYCLSEMDIQISFYTYSDFNRNILGVIRENPDVTIVSSHYEDSDYPFYLNDLGYQIIRSHSKGQKIVFVLYEQIDNALPKEWLCFLKVPWQDVNLCERLKKVIENRVIPKNEEIDELNRLYPPIKIDHHH